MSNNSFISDIFNYNSTFHWQERYLWQIISNPPLRLTTVRAALYFLHFQIDIPIFLFILSIPPLWLSSQTEGLNSSWCSWSEQYVWNNYIHSCWDHTQARVEKTVWKWALFVHMLYLLLEASVVRRVYTGQKIRKTIIGLLQMFLGRLIYGWKLQKPACFFLLLLLK